jgi:RNA polymerase sigma-70 factor (ECF subfamily)
MTGDRPPADEQALVASALAGDEGALGRLLGLHQQSAYNVAYRLLGSEADARDAVQEAFLLTVRAVRGEGAPPRDIARFEPWLRRVATNAALGELRRRPSFRPGPVDENADPVSTGEYGDPARAAERREARGDVLRALLTLPDRQRAALTLREYEGLSYDEIATLLGVSRGAVERLLFRARRGFRDGYEGLMAGARPVGCPEFVSLLSAAADNELSTAALQDLNAHLDRCANCRRELDGLRRARQLVALMPLLATPAGWNPVAAAIQRAAWAATEAARSAAAGIPAGSGPTTGSGGAAGANAAGASAGASGAPATSQAVGGSLMAKLTAVTGAKAVAVLVAAGVAVGVTATQLAPSSTAPAASPTAAAPLVPAGASPPAASPSPTTPPAVTRTAAILATTPSSGGTVAPSATTPTGTPAAASTPNP